MANLIIIPARFASQRFPGKLLESQTGWPLIRHVVERCRAARGVDRVVVAADGERIAGAVRAFGGEAVLTDSELATGTDRVAAAALALGLRDAGDRIVNVQGDEPDIDPAHIEMLFRLLDEPERDRGARVAGALGVATLAARRRGPEGFDDPNRVKVVTDPAGFALYFSRAPIPFPRDGFPPGADWLYHVGAYGFHPGALRRFASTPPTPLESIEKLEQLRFLELGFSVHVGIVAEAASGIDTPEDYRRFVDRSRKQGTRGTGREARPRDGEGNRRT